MRSVGAGAVQLMTRDLSAGLEHVRTTPVFDQDSVPAGLLAAHRIATDHQKPAEMADVHQRWCTLGPANLS